MRILTLASGAALACLLFPAAGSAQTSGCSVTATPTFIRGEGTTELIGDILIRCSGGTPTPANQPIPQNNLTFSVATAVTSRILSTNGASEALLIIDDAGAPGQPVQRLCPSSNGCTVLGTGGVGTPFSGVDATRPNIFQGVVNGNTVVFLGVPVDHGGARTYRVKNVRINATPLSASVGPIPVRANISSAAFAGFLIDNPSPIVGMIFSSLAFSSGAITASTCEPLNRTKNLLSISYTENYASAFRSRTISGTDTAGTAQQNVPTVGYFSESGLILPSLPGAGLADFGTRFKAVFRNIPAGVSIWVSTQNSGGGTARLTASEAGAYSPVASTDTVLGSDVAQLPVVNGTATAVWEVVSASEVASDVFSFLAFFESSVALERKATAISVAGGYAPGTGATVTAIPRFAETSTATDIVVFDPCQTTMLFPFVVSGDGFDVGISIGNTTKDPFGTTVHPGTCNLTAYGSGQTQAYETPVINGGFDLTVSAATVFPKPFRGYVFAVCDFPLGHGYAFVSDTGIRNFATGYMALVLPPGSTERPRAAEGFAEKLVQ